MGTYRLSAEEIKDSMRDWLQSLEGDAYAKEIAEAYNLIAKEEEWQDKLKT